MPLTSPLNPQFVLTKTEDDTVRRRGNRLLHKLAQKCDKLPSSLVLENIVLLEREPSCIGGFADVFQASYRGQLVALKRLRRFQNPENYEKVQKVN
jgi:hypothetical protein